MIDSSRANTRQEAREKGLTTYFTGKICKNGHITERNTSTGACRQCVWESNHRSEEEKQRIKRLKSIEQENAKSEYGEQLISRAEARSKGLTHYFTGKECKNGHISKRLTKCGRCLECCNMWVRRDYSNNPDKFRKQAKDRYALDPEKHAQKAANWRAENPDRVKEIQKGYRERNPRIVSERKKEWRKNNPDYAAEHREKNRGEYMNYSATRRIRRNAAVATFIETMMIKIKYEQCAALNDEAGYIKYHVDHIWPLSRGGPHLPWNLQIITAESNSRKGSKLIS